MDEQPLWISETRRPMAGMETQPDKTRQGNNGIQNSELHETPLLLFWGIQSAVAGQNVLALMQKPKQRVQLGQGKKIRRAGGCQDIKR